MKNLPNSIIFERSIGDICAILRLDGAAQARLSALRAKAGLPDAPFYGHVTLAHFRGLSKAEAEAWSAAAVREMSVPPLYYDEAGQLSALCAACFVRRTPALLACHLAYHRQYDAYCDEWTAAGAGIWRPHSSLYAGAEAPSVAARLRDCFLPFQARATALELSEILPDGFDVFAAWPLAY